MEQLVNQLLYSFEILSILKAIHQQLIVMAIPNINTPISVRPDLHCQEDLTIISHVELFA